MVAPGQIRASHYEDPPLFSSQVSPLYGPGIRQTAIGPIFELFMTYLGDQWRIGDWAGPQAAVKVPVLFTHHGRYVDPDTGVVLGAISDLRASRVGEFVKGAGAAFEYVSLPGAAHAMHNADPGGFVEVLGKWASALPA